MAPLDSPSIYYSARRFDAVNSIDRSPANTADIVASGALIWRMRDGALEVLIIHRPRYDDWSWPKGKQDPGESLAETAIREIREEVGLQVVLGVPLAVTSYPVGGRPKDVFYWAAELPDGARALADEGEVDELRWVTTDVARALLTNQDDLAPWNPWRLWLRQMRCVPARFSLPATRRLSRVRTGLLLRMTVRSRRPVSVRRWPLAVSLRRGLRAVLFLPRGCVAFRP